MLPWYACLYNRGRAGSSSDGDEAERLIVGARCGAPSREGGSHETCEGPEWWKGRLSGWMAGGGGRRSALRNAEGWDSRMLTLRGIDAARVRQESVCPAGRGA